MNIGHLNIPKPEMKDVGFIHDIHTQLYLVYLRLIENDDSGKKVLKALEADPRVQALVGRMISRGSGSAIFEIKTLAMWFLWAVNEYGPQIAELNMNKFLDFETVPVINTLWVLGIEIDNPIELENGIRIVSIEEMPDSLDKHHYQKHEFGGLVHRIPKPKAAIIYACNIKKAISDDLSESQDKQFWDSSRALYEVALLLNAIDGVSCIPYFSSSYTLPEMPIGMFGGSGGSALLYDIFGYRTTKLSTSSTSEINSLLIAFGALSSDKKARMSRVLSRLSQSKRRVQIEDKILDLGIALEMALLEDNNNNDQLSLSFRLRGSWLIGTNPEERQVIYCQLRDVYNYRSQVAHSGVLCGNDVAKKLVVNANLQEYELLAEKVIRQLIYTNNPDWSNLILGTPLVAEGGCG